MPAKRPSASRLQRQPIALKASDRYGTIAIAAAGIEIVIGAIVTAIATCAVTDRANHAATIGHAARIVTMLLRCDVPSQRRKQNVHQEVYAVNKRHAPSNPHAMINKRAATNNVRAMRLQANVRAVSAAGAVAGGAVVVARGVTAARTRRIPAATQGQTRGRP